MLISDDILSSGTNRNRTVIHFSSSPDSFSGNIGGIFVELNNPEHASKRAVRAFLFRAGVGNQREFHVAGRDAAFDFHDAFADFQAVDIDFLAVWQEEGFLRGLDVVLVLKAEDDQRVRVAREIYGRQARVLRDVDKPLAEASDLPEQAFEAVGCLALAVSPREEVVDFLKECHMPELLGLPLVQAAEMNEAKENLRQECP